LSYSSEPSESSVPLSSRRREETPPSALYDELTETVLHVSARCQHLCSWPCSCPWPNSWPRRCLCLRLFPCLCPRPLSLSVFMSVSMAIPCTHSFFFSVFSSHFSVPVYFLFHVHIHVGVLNLNLKRHFRGMLAYALYDTYIESVTIQYE
jgi:hypothetical protein